MKELKISDQMKSNIEKILAEAGVHLSHEYKCGELDLIECSIKIVGNAEVVVEYQVERQEQFKNTYVHELK